MYTLKSLPYQLLEWNKKNNIIKSKTDIKSSISNIKNVLLFHFYLRPFYTHNITHRFVYQLNNLIIMYFILNIIFKLLMQKYKTVNVTLYYLKFNNKN